VSAGNLVRFPSVLQSSTPSPAELEGSLGLDIASDELSYASLTSLASLPSSDIDLYRIDSVAYVAVKRIFDVLFASAAILVSAPLLLLIAILIKLSSPGPIFFCQDRIGKDGNVFRMMKFRSMRVTAEEDSDRLWTVPGDSRVTPFGSFLRRTSMDELPQFFNVVCGHMSVVGPRPERPYYVDRFCRDYENYAVRHYGHVGITGWAQVNGWRGDTSIEKRLEYDLAYLRHWSMLLDCRIITLTVFRGVFGKNAY
jgi:exopolysaccharide biosynthesis polyprenyl glycosylphosphotransferase